MMTKGIHSALAPKKVALLKIIRWPESIHYIRHCENGGFSVKKQEKDKTGKLLPNMEKAESGKTALTAIIKLCFNQFFTCNAHFLLLSQVIVLYGLKNIQI